MLLELHVLADAVGRDAEDDRAGLLELAVRVADPARLSGTARRVVLGVEVEDDRLAAEARQADLLARVALEREVGRRITFVYHEICKATRC